MSAGSVAAFKDIGLNGDTMAKVFTKGGPEASKALGDVLQRIKAIEDPAKRNATAVALFGTKAEDLQGALFKLDPSTAVKALGDVKGATDKAGNAMRDNAATKFEAFKRGAMQGLVTVIGNYVVPALVTGADYAVKFGKGIATAAGFVSDHSTAFTVAAGLITAFFLPTLVALAAQAWATTTAVVTGWITQGTAQAGALASFLAANATILAGWIAQGAGAVAAAARVVGAWVLMGAQSMIQAARMAAAWVISMGPVGLIIAAVVALVALIVANWDTIVSATKTAWEWVWNKIKAVGQFLLDLFLNFTLVGIIIKHWDSIKSGTVRVWNAIVDWVKGLPQKLINFFLNWTLPGLIIKHWQSIKDGSVRKATELVNWVRGLPGRIASGIGSLKSLLYDKGTDVVRGLWNGIKSMGSWLKSTLISWAKDLIPGPIAKALGIHSPSRVMAKKVGRWIPAGVVAGIRANSAVLDRTMSNLVTPPPVPALAGATTGAGAERTRSARAPPRPCISSIGTAASKPRRERARPRVAHEGEGVTGGHRRPGERVRARTARRAAARTRHPLPVALPVRVGRPPRPRLRERQPGRRTRRDPGPAARTAARRHPRRDPDTGPTGRSAPSCSSSAPQRPSPRTSSRSSCSSTSAAPCSHGSG